MSSKEKEEFANRMNEVADDLGIPEKGKNRQKSLGTRFHVSQEAARKWLTGEGFPSTEKSIEIAKAAEVNYEWFMTGRGEKKYSLNMIPPEVKEWILKSATNIAPPVPSEDAAEKRQDKSIKLKSIDVPEKPALPQFEKFKTSGIPRVRKIITGIPAEKPKEEKK